MYEIVIDQAHHAIVDVNNTRDHCSWHDGSDSHVALACSVAFADGSRIGSMANARLGCGQGVVRCDVCRSLHCHALVGGGAVEQGGDGLGAQALL